MIYHQVLDELDPYRSGEPDKEKFAWQMSLISKYFNPLPLSQALTLLEKRQLPANSVCVTFDDGYLNNLEVAMPILKKHAVPATVFVASAFSDGNNMWNDRILDLFAQCNNDVMDLSAADKGKVEVTDSATKFSLLKETIIALKYYPIEERLQRVDKLIKDNGNFVEQRRMMSPTEIKSLSDAGIEIGAHTHNHPILKGLDEASVRQEITQNRTLLEQWIGKPVRGFAYPNGKPGIDFDDATVELIKALDFDYAVTTEWGISNPEADQYRLRRFTPWDSQAWKFQARMLSNLFRKAES